MDFTMYVVVVFRQFNYNISVRGYSYFNNKKALKIKACGVSQTPKSFYYMEGSHEDYGQCLFTWCEL